MRYATSQELSLIYPCLLGFFESEDRKERGKLYKDNGDKKLEGKVDTKREGKVDTKDMGTEVCG